MVKTSRPGERAGQAMSSATVTIVPIQSAVSGTSIINLKSTCQLAHICCPAVWHMTGAYHVLRCLAKPVALHKMGYFNMKGECFVFDERVSIDHSLKKGQYTQFFACRSALSKKDIERCSFAWSSKYH